MIGQTISHYRILEKLGEGGMGVVYKAEDIKLRRNVALKILQAGKGLSVEDKIRFMREAQAAATLNHPNVAVIHEFDEVDGQAFIAMEYVEGVTLKDKIRQQPLPVSEAVEVAIAILEGLWVAHQNGIVHRDLKPDNVMVTSNGHVKIMDFGVASIRGRSRVTQAGMTVGTVAYMSPEQARGQQLDHRTDIWSLGVMIYEMLTSSLPFHADYDQAIVYQILNSEPKRPSTIRPEIPAELERIVLKALAKPPAGRFQSAEALLEELKNFDKQSGSSPSIEASRGRRIAVLPLANISADPNDEYFADGMTEEVISSLSRIGGLRVIARTSVMRYKGTARPISEIATELRADSILEGSVRKATDKLRITVQLVDPVTEEHIWSEEYDRPLKDVFEIQSDVARRVAEGLRVRLIEGEERQIDKKATADLDAYSEFLKGRFHWNKRTTEGLRKAAEHFQAAIDRDPRFTPAHAGLADSLALLGDVGIAAIPPSEAFSKSKAAALKALEIDPDMPEAHTSLAHIYMHEYQWSEAEKEFHTALALNSNYATTHHWYAFFLAIHHKHEESVARMRRALELDPVSLAINTDLGMMFYYARDYDEAIAQYRKTIDMDPSFTRTSITLASAYLQKGMHEEAIKLYQKALGQSDDPAKLAVLARAYAVSGNRDEALRIVARLLQASSQRYVSPYSLTLIYCALGENDKAFEWLDISYDKSSADMIFLSVDPFLDNVRSDPRFRDLLRRVRIEK